MCLLFSILIWPALSYNLRLLAWGIGLAAGIRIIFDTVAYIIGRQIDRKDGSVVSRELWISSRLLAVVSKMPRIRKFVHRWVPLFVVFFLGRASVQLEQYNRTQQHTFQVDEVLPHSRYLMRIVEKGRPVGKQELHKVCEHETDPQFEPGMRVDITYQLSSDSRGACDHMNGPGVGYGAAAYVNKATGKLIDYREAQ